MLSKLEFLVPPRFRKKNEFAKDDTDLFFVRTSDRYRTIEELIQESKLSQTYYFMVIFSGIIVTVGLLMSNMAIVIAGMLVAPILKPVLAISLGIITRNMRLVFRSFAIVVLSAIFVVAVSMSIYFFFGQQVISSEFGSLFRFNTLYLLLAFFSGMAAAFAWTKKRTMEDALAGTAIAVTILPPLGMLGIHLADFNTVASGEVLYVFIYNLATIIAGSALVFVLSGFTRKPQITREIDSQLDKEQKS